MSILTSAILTRFEGVIEAIPTPAPSPPRGFRKSISRYEFGHAPESGIDGTFRIEATGVGGVRQVFGTGEVTRNLGQVVCRMAYYRGGGSLGGARRGGDRKSINRRAIDDVFLVVKACEDEVTYDSGNTGIRVVHFAGFQRSEDLEHVEIWDTTFNVEWQAAVVTS